MKRSRGIDHPAWEAFLKNFDDLAMGLDENGEPIFIDSEGHSWGAILIFGESDLEQNTVGWGMKSYNSADECCGWCLANRSNLPVTDLSDTAGWRPTEKMSHEVFKSLTFGP